VDKVIYTSEMNNVRMDGQTFEHLRVDRDHLFEKLGSI
jgi:hypothetical protein